MPRPPSADPLLTPVPSVPGVRLNTNTGSHTLTFTHTHTHTHAHTHTYAQVGACELINKQNTLTVTFNKRESCYLPCQRTLPHDGWGGLCLAGTPPPLQHPV